MKKKHLISLLDSVDRFSDPNIHLEQYPTPSVMAAELSMRAQRNGDLEGCVVCDLGAGTGVLTAAAVAGGAAHVLSVEIDPSAMDIGVANMEALGMDEVVDWIHADVQSLPLRHSGFADTVLMNPPFGTRDKGIDIRFIEAAHRVIRAGGTIYSMHKSSTRRYVSKAIDKLGMVGEAVAEMAYPLPQTYRHHKDKVRRIQVDLWAIHKPVDKQTSIESQ